MRTRLVPTVVAAALVAAALSSCEPSSTCVDYGYYEDDPAKMAEAADLVVTGRQSPTGNTVFLYSAHVAVHEIEVDEVLKGHLDDTTIEALAPPGGCFDVGSTVPESDDILNVDGTAEFFLLHFEDHWLTLSPYEGVEPVPSTGELPWEPTP